MSGTFGGGERGTAGGAELQPRSAQSGTAEDAEKSAEDAEKRAEVSAPTAAPWGFRFLEK